MSSMLMRTVCSVSVLGLLAFGPFQAQAEQLIGLTTQNSLVSFDSATPGAVVGPVAITGQLAGDVFVGIDRRPVNGLLYGLAVQGTVGRLYTINPMTGAATFQATLDVAVAGTSFGVDFNPVPDRLRVVSDTGRNLRINVDNGATTVDVPLAYQAGDPNVGVAPIDTAVAYSNNFAGTTATTLRGVDVGLDNLVVHTNPNGGTLQTALALGFNTNEMAGYDVSGVTGTPYFSFTAPGSGISKLFTAGPGGFTEVGDIGGGLPLVGLAADVGTPVPEPGSLLLLGLGVAGLAGFGWRRRQQLA